MSLIRLFHMAVPGRVHSRAFRCLWVLHELGIKNFEVFMLTPGQAYAPQMRAQGVRFSTKVPTLLLDGREVGDSGVICQLLAERVEDEINLLGDKHEQLEKMQWMGFAETCVSLRVPLMPSLMDPNKTLAEIHSEVIEPQRQVFKGNIERFETHFREHKRDYLLDSGFSIADAMCGWGLDKFHSWGLMDLATGTSPLTLAYLKRLQSRPAFVRAKQYAELPPGLHNPI